MTDPSPTDLSSWSAAQTLTDIGSLVADWLEGARPWLPTYDASQPDAETGPHIITALARINRAGWITDSSQPGLVQGEHRQRAYVAGLVDPWIGFYAEYLSVGTDLVVLHVDRAGRPDDAEDVASIPVTAMTGHPSTWLGRWEPVGREIVLAAPLSPGARAAVSAANVLQVFDPVWGRDDVLWPWLHQLADDLTDGTAATWLQAVVAEYSPEAAS